MDVLCKRINDAKGDYRDVIAWAEYPSYSKNWDSFKLPADQREKIYSDDWQQYLDWANAK